MAKEKEPATGGPWMLVLAARLLASRCDGTGTPLYVDECDEATDSALRAWRYAGLCRIIHGPGRAWWCATALGRVQLTEGE